MHTPTSSPPAFVTNLAPVAHEIDVTDLPVRGALPAGLHGRLVRNGPNPRQPDAGAHWFEGDGMLHEFTFQDGRVAYRNRWVRTARWLAQAADGAHAPPADVDSSVANTNVLVHAGTLLALEEAHLPLAVDPASLDDAQTWTFHGRAAGAFTAHPKVDPGTGEMIFFGYGNPTWFEPGMVYGVVDAAGGITRWDRFVAPYASMVHDFAVSQHRAVFPVMPLTPSVQRAQAGLPFYAWEAERACHLGVLDRDAPLDTLHWRDLPSCFVYHTVNAWDEGDMLYVDVMQSDVPALFPTPDGSPPRGNANASLWRWTVDCGPGGSPIVRHQICPLSGEFPRIDERYLGLAYRHAWFVGDGEDGSPFNRVVHWDHQAGHSDGWDLPADACASEGVFVAASPDAAEGEGWLLTVVFHGASQHSELLVFDARAVNHGPLATVELPQRVPNGFHGNWIAATPAPA